MKIGRALVALFGSLLVLTCTLMLLRDYTVLASPDTRYVDPTGTCDSHAPCYTALQAAVDAAVAGDTILVYPGTYVENVSAVQDDLTLQSQAGASSTIIHAADSTLSALKTTGQHVVVRGFTVRNTATACDIYYGGITVDGDHTTLSDNIATGNCKGIVVSASYVTITHNTLSDNRAYSGGDGIYVWPGCTDILIGENVISGNTDEGIQEELDAFNVTVVTNTITNNGGRGIYLGTGTGDLPEDTPHNCRIENNTITFSGEDGIYLGTRPRGNRIQGNTIRLNGGHGIDLGTFPVSNQIISNTIELNSGTGILFRRSGNDVLIASNVISHSGVDGIYMGTTVLDMPEDWLDGVTYSNDHVIKDNTITANGRHGVYLGKMPIGNDLLGNTISANGGDGIQFGGESITYYEFSKPFLTVISWSNDILRNNIRDNVDHGILCSVSELNRIGMNNLINNDGGNAFCQSPYQDSNRWHSLQVTYLYEGDIFEGHLGNYWDDYGQVVTAPVDVDPYDGIADEPYPVPGDPSETDYYPLLLPFESYLPSPPDAAFVTSSPDWLGQVTGFTNATMPDAGATYLWEFGDSVTSTLEHPTHVYPSPGFYTVTLTATNSADSDTATGQVLIYGPPTAGFIAHPTAGLGPLTVIFTDQATTLPVPDPTLTYLWRFGDGQESTLRNPVHTYLATGVYTASQTVTNAAGSDVEIKISFITVREGHRVHLPVILRDTSD